MGRLNAEPQSAQSLAEREHSALPPWPRMRDKTLIEYCVTMSKIGAYRRLVIEGVCEGQLSTEGHCG